MNKKNDKVTVVNERTIVDGVLSKINKFKENGELVLPKDYYPENALKSAYLILSETVDKEGNPVLNFCTKASIANALLNMVVQGLSPMKNQCYFIAYGNKLQMSRSYLGSIAVARRVGLRNIVANVVFKDDVFKYQIEQETGLFKILDHEQDMDNIDISKIRGAYAITTMEDGTSNVTVMTLAQIKNSWMQGYAKGNSKAHTNFTDEMCKKTVYNRACKPIINSSTDLILTTNNSVQEDTEELKPVQEKEANIKEIEIVAEPVKEETIDSAENKGVKDKTPKPAF